MYYNYDIITAIQQLYQLIGAQQTKITELEATIIDLQKNVDTLRLDSSRKVERIEYKFDQLKVERLEGTLNIGITPTGGIEPSSFEDFSVNRNSIDIANNQIQGANPVVFENVKNAVYEYLNKECYDVLASIERQYNYQLDASYRNFIVDDIRKQIDSRIHYYLRGINVVENDEAALKELEGVTVQNVKNDIHRTLEEFIKHLPQKGE